MALSVTVLKAQQQGPPPSVAPGLEINRSELIRKLNVYNADYIFETAKTNDKFETIKSTNKSDVTTEIYGSENDVESAACTFVFTTDTAASKSGFIKLAGFVFALTEKPGLDWYFSQIKYMNENRTSSFTHTERFNYMRRLEFVFDPKNKYLKIRAVHL